MKAALVPYYIVAVLAGISTLLGFILALAWPALSLLSQAAGLGVATGLIAWTVAGSVQLVGLTIWHAEQRAKLMRGVEESKVELARRRRGETTGVTERTR